MSVLCPSYFRPMYNHTRSREKNPGKNLVKKSGKSPSKKPKGVKGPAIYNFILYITKFYKYFIF